MILVIIGIFRHFTHLYITNWKLPGADFPVLNCQTVDRTEATLNILTVDSSESQYCNHQDDADNISVGQCSGAE